MKRGLIIVLVLSLLVGMMSLSSFAAVRNYQNGGMMNGGKMMNGNFAGRGGMMNGDYSGMMNGDYSGGIMNGDYSGGMMNGDYSGMMNGTNSGGMMNGNNSGGMMNGNFNGMMGTGYSNGTNAGVLSENAISLDAAYDIGKSYLEKELSSEYTLDKDGIATGDYYTFFIESNDKTVGRLSVNALTSEVWLHNCRGLLQ